jgi:hypothetical protein
MGFMGIAAAVVFVFGVYALFKRLRGEKIPEETRQLGGRIGRSVHAAVPLPGLMGQAPASMLPEPEPDRIGPEEGHVASLTEPSGNDTDDLDLAAVRAQLDAVLPLPEARRKKRRRAS